MDDARFSTRLLMRAPAFAAVVVFTLSLGIGAATAIFSIVNGILFRSLPYPDADRVVQIWEVSSKNGHRTQFSDLNFFDLQAQSRSFAGLAEFQAWGSVTVLDGASPGRANLSVVSRDFFAILGVSPERGRLFGPDERRLGGAPAVVISDGFWRRHFGSSLGVLGKALTINGKSYTVVGIMPPTLNFPLGTDFWVPRELTPPVLTFPRESSPLRS